MVPDTRQKGTAKVAASIHTSHGERHNCASASRPRAVRAIATIAASSST